MPTSKTASQQHTVTPKNGQLLLEKGANHFTR